MAKRGARRARNRTPFSNRPGTLLDSFSEFDLDRWNENSAAAQTYYDRCYFDLERQRASHYDELCAALRAGGSIEYEPTRWVRLTDWRWSMRPLSSLGSLRGIGGRFNIGDELTRARGQAFPSLYVASDFDTAFRERFGNTANSKTSSLTLMEHALRSTSSFTTFVIEGKLEYVFDLRSDDVLNPFVEIIRRFQFSDDTKRLARKYGMKPRRLVRTAKELRSRLLLAPLTWRAEPNLSSIPSSNQVFGGLLKAAGFEAVLYPSQQGGQECLAIFPQNLSASSSEIRVIGRPPDGAACTVLNNSSRCLD